MLYTIGNEPTYRNGILAEHPSGFALHKGRGGAVWLTRKDADDFLARHHNRYYWCGVFGVEANWATTKSILPGNMSGDHVPWYEWVCSGARMLPQPAQLVLLDGNGHY